MTGSAPGASTTARRFGPPARELWSFAELLGLAALVVAQPAYDLAGRNAEIFATHRVDTAGLVLFTAAVLLVPPAVLWVVEVLAGLVAPRVRPVVHAGLIGALLGVWIAVASHRAGLAAAPSVLVGVAGAAVGFVLRWRVTWARTFVRVIAVAAPVFALLFLFASPAADVVGGTGAHAADAATPSRRHRVVWISFDELPLTSLLDGQGRIDRELFPNFAALADRSTWYRNSTTVAPYTIAALPAMLSGRLPTEKYAPAVLANHPHNVFTLLGKSYRVHAHESFTRLCPPSTCGTTSPGLGTSVGGALGDTADLLGSFMTGDRAASRATAVEGLVAEDPDPVATTERFVRQIGAGGDTFDFLHVLLPHWPWHYRGTLQDDGDRRNLLGWVDNPWAGRWSAVSGRQRHLLQLQAADTLLGQITARLRAEHAWDDSVIVVTADHGIGFAPGDPPRGLTTAETPDIVWTPLFVKYPGQAAGTVDDRPARTVDILPTVADVIGARIPWRTDGRSLRGAPADPARPVEVFHWDFDRLQPAAGSQFNEVDGRAGFAAVLARRASLPLGDPALRLYRIGPYAGLVGTPVAEHVGAGPGPTVTMSGDPRRFTHVRPGAAVAPWLEVSGTLTPGRDAVPLAIAVNGRVAAVTQTVEPKVGGPAAWWAALPPQLFRPGANEVRIYGISGPPTAPRLVPVRTG